MQNTNTESLGRRIARLRLEHKMTQERLADLMNVSAQAVSKWENDQSYPDIMLLPELARTFSVSVDELLGVGGEVPVAAAAPEPAPAPEPEPQSAPEPAPVSTSPFAQAVREAHAPAEPEPQPATASPFAQAVREAREAQQRSAAGADAVEVDAETMETDLGRRAAQLHIRVSEHGREEVNIAIPLAATRLITAIAENIPGLDAVTLQGYGLDSLISAVEAAEIGTLVDIDDGDSHVLITLE